MEYAIPETAQTIMIVVGADLRAEVTDRPLAYRLADQFRSWRSDHADKLNLLIEPIVLTDVWYLNHEALHDRPTISIGRPEVNALSRAFRRAIRKTGNDKPDILIRLDPEFTDLRCCLWGIDHNRTARAVDLFVLKFLDGFITAAATQVEPRSD